VNHPQRRGRRFGRRWRGGAVGLLVAAAVVTGCTTARSDLSTSAGPCYLALPTATKAVDGEGHLLGVQRVTVDVLRREAPDLYREVPRSYAASTRLCVVAFSGQFDAASVAGAGGRPSGRLAVVISTASGNHLLGTVIFLKPPLRMGRSEVG
jgi:hypothetical protein